MLASILVVFLPPALVLTDRFPRPYDRHDAVTSHCVHESNVRCIYELNAVVTRVYDCIFLWFCLFHFYPLPLIPEQIEPLDLVFCVDSTTFVSSHFFHFLLAHGAAHWFYLSGPA